MSQLDLRLLLAGIDKYEYLTQKVVVAGMEKYEVLDRGCCCRHEEV